jgi:hypothetical protein
MFGILYLSIYLIEVSPQIYFGAHPPLINEGIFLGVAPEESIMQMLISIVIIVAV